MSEIMNNTANNESAVMVVNPADMAAPSLLNAL